MPRKDFPEDVRRKCLLWSARHCCLCGDECGLDIEIAHLPSMEKRDDLESAIPLCHTCHAQIGRYDPKHPLGSKYKPEELRLRREQVYEQFTRHLVPPVTSRFYQDETIRLPQVGFAVTNHGLFPPVRAEIRLGVFLGDESLGGIHDTHGYYCGPTRWSLNPSTEIRGNFHIPEQCVGDSRTLRIQTEARLVDAYERAHDLLPFCHVYVRESNIWSLEPTTFEELKARAREKGYSL